MFRFEHPEYLYALIVLPLLVVLYLWAVRRNRVAGKRLGEAHLLQRLMPGASVKRHHLKGIILLLALAFLIVGWSNPQWGSRRESVTRKGIDVFLALDISRSMLATDIAPNRMERAKKFSEQLIQSLRGDRVGLIFFAGGPFLQMPLSTDYRDAMTRLQAASPDLTPNQGTDLGAAIRLALRTFDAEKRNHQALIVISDGEDHDADALAAAEEAAEEGMIILSVGVGTEQGSRIPVTVGGRRDFLRDDQGQVVETKLQEEALRDIAEATRGSFFYLDRGDAVIRALREQIDQVEKQEYEQRVFDQYESYFQYFVGIGLLLLLAEFLLPYRRDPNRDRPDLFADKS